MEKMYKPSEEKLESINKQYYGIKNNLEILRQGMKSKEFSNMTKAEKQSIKYQYGFLKRALRSSVLYLINYNYAHTSMLKDALFNFRYINCYTRWRVIKELAKRPIIALMEDEVD